MIEEHSRRTQTLAKEKEVFDDAFTKLSMQSRQGKRKAADLQAAVEQLQAQLAQRDVEMEKQRVLVALATLVHCLVLVLSSAPLWPS